MDVRRLGSVFCEEDAAVVDGRPTVPMLGFQAIALALVFSYACETAVHGDMYVPEPR